jgi:hypothetical protein
MFCNLQHYWTRKRCKPFPASHDGRRTLGTLTAARMQPPQMAALDAWIAKQREPLTRPEAIRRLVEAGLKATIRERK